MFLYLISRLLMYRCFFSGKAFLIGKNQNLSEIDTLYPFYGEMECWEGEDLLVIIQMVVAKPPRSCSGAQTKTQHSLS